jgi:hypothetical protein
MPDAIKRYWRIEGYESQTKIFEKTVDVGQFTINQMKELVKALAAKAGLNYGEIVGAYAKRGTKIANQLLEVHRDGPPRTFSCGINPHFVARIVKDKP